MTGPLEKVIHVDEQGALEGTQMGCEGEQGSLRPSVSALEINVLTDVTACFPS